MYNNIIFDIDGTILDTEVVILSALQKLLKEELNRDFSFDELKVVLGIPGEEGLKKFGISNLDYCCEKWDRYMKEYFNNVKVFDDMKETICELKDIGVSLSIVTSKTKGEFEHDFVPFGLLSHFDTIICADDTEKHKPHPDPILKLIEITGNDKKDYLYIGDTIYDRECAAGAGIAFALALWGAKTSKGIDANYVLENPKEILKLAKGSYVKL